MIISRTTLVGLKSDMCQDPSHFFLWIQILIKIKKLHFYFCFSLSCQDPGTQDACFQSILAILWGLNHFIKEEICHTEHWTVDNQTQFSKSTVTHCVLIESTFSDKTSQGMEHFRLAYSPFRSVVVAQGHSRSYKVTLVFCLCNKI